jgi:hypothetical protein
MESQSPDLGRDAPVSAHRNRASFEERLAAIRRQLARQRDEERRQWAIANQNPNDGEASFWSRNGLDPTEHEGGRNPWTRAETEEAFGFAARRYLTQVAKLDRGAEALLRPDWDRLESGESWAEARDGIQRGWDSATQH